MHIRLRKVLASSLIHCCSRPSVGQGDLFFCSCARPTHLLLRLPARTQVVAQVGALLDSKGPHRHIEHPDLRLFWREVYSPDKSAPW